MSCGSPAGTPKRKLLQVQNGVAVSGHGVSPYLGAGLVLLGAVLAGILINAVFATRLFLAEAPAPTPSVRELGIALMTSHIIPLEVIGLLLTVALLGAVVLALPEREQSTGGAGR